MVDTAEALTPLGLPYYIINMLDVLRESSILMSVGLICLDFASRAKKMHQDARFSGVQSIAADVTW